MPPKTVVGRALGNELHPDAHKPLSAQPSRDGVGFALTDTPISTAPSSPQMYVAPPPSPFLFLPMALVDRPASSSRAGMASPGLSGPLASLSRAAVCI